MRTLVPMPGSEHLAERLAERLGIPVAAPYVRHFPDGETFARVEPVEGEAIVLAALHHPDPVFLAHLFVADTLRELGATRLTLLAPYLAYMRQDVRFARGEAVSSRTVARLLSQSFDRLVTVDPHLHRIDALSDLYTIPDTVVHATAPIAAWIQDTIARPVIVGPDAESEQWVAPIAEAVGAPFVVATKTRRGDRDVSIALPDAELAERTPVLVDDIISTGRTMLGAIEQLAERTARAPYVVGVHGVFAEGALAELRAAGARDIVTCNTIPHATNGIDVSGVLADALAAI